MVWKEIFLAVGPEPRTPEQKPVYPFAQAGIFIILGFVAFLLLRYISPDVARWAILFGFLAAVARVWPRQGIIGIFGVSTYIALDILGFLTPMRVGLTVVLTIIAVLYSMAPEKFDNFVKFLYFLGGGVAIFLFSTWAQTWLKWTYIHVATVLLLLAFIVSVLLGIKQKWIGFMLLVVNVLFYVLLLTTNIYPGLREGSPMYSAVEGQRAAWSLMFTGIKTFGQEAYTGLREQYFFEFTEYEVGVEAQSQKPLGVFLENVDVASKVVAPDGTIDVYARLRAESFKVDRNLTIKVACYEKNFELIAEKQGMILPKSSFTVEEYELQELDCIFNASALGIGSHVIVLDTSFDFVTSAFLKAYFMEQERIRDYRRQQLDPLDVFGITDKNPVAVFTGGPLRIGMGFDRQPVALIPAEPGFGPAFGITFDRNWFEGELSKIAKVTLTVPPGLVVRTVDGNSVSQYCRGGGQAEYVCTFSDVAILSKFFPEEPIVTPKTLRVQTAATDVATVLAGAPLAIRSFKVTVDYAYRIKKEASVTVKKREVKV